MKRKGAPVGPPVLKRCEFKDQAGARCYETGIFGFCANIFTGAPGHWFCLAHRQAGELLMTAAPDDREERAARLRGPGRQERLF